MSWSEETEHKNHNKNHWERNKSNPHVGQSIGSTELINTTRLMKMIDSGSQILTGVVKLEITGADLAEEAWSPTHPRQPAQLTSDTGHCPQRCWFLLFLDLNHCLNLLQFWVRLLLFQLFRNNQIKSSWHVRTTDWYYYSWIMLCIYLPIIFKTIVLSDWCVIFKYFWWHLSWSLSP